MDAFESVVKLLLDSKGYWVRTSYKVSLTKGEKQIIGRPSCPRWELDLVAYRATTNELLVMECKSYLDSPGVSALGFTSEKASYTKRYKLFNDAVLRNVVLNRLATQAQEEGLCQPNPSIRLGLAAGKVSSPKDRDLIKEHFSNLGWWFYDDEEIRKDLSKFASSKFENDAVLITTKLLLRKGL